MAGVFFLWSRVCAVCLRGPGYHGPARLIANSQAWHTARTITQLYTIRPFPFEPVTGHYVMRSGLRLLSPSTADSHMGQTKGSALRSLAYVFVCQLRKKTGMQGERPIAPLPPIPSRFVCQMSHVQKGGVRGLITSLCPLPYPLFSSLLFPLLVHLG